MRMKGFLTSRTSLGLESYVCQKKGRVLVYSTQRTHAIFITYPLKWIIASN